MFKYLLISKYLRRKLAPLFAAVAVMLCTTMVIVVMSVMGGFLDMLRESAQRLTGDVTVSSGTMGGMPHYEELIVALEDLPEVAAATPVVRGYGLLQLGRSNFPVEVEGIYPESLERIIGFRQTLMWDGKELFGPDNQLDLIDAGMQMALPDNWPLRGDNRPTMVMGIEANPAHARDAQGQYNPRWAAIGIEATLTVLPVSQRGSIIDAAVKPTRFVVVNEFKSGLYEIDANRVYVGFEQLQKILVMNESLGSVDEQGNITDEAQPARASEVLVKASPGFTVEQTRDAVRYAVIDFMAKYPDLEGPRIRTWEERHSTLLSAVQNEKGLVTFLFVIISVVAVVMVATTFYMIVLEKTRDIGVLRAIGASRLGILNLFLGYGLAIGTLGAVVGLIGATLIVTNLNEIQALLNAWFGWQMWDPQVYFFESIPDDVDVFGAICVAIGAVISSVVGASIPAILAAKLNPVEALRYE